MGFQWLCASKKAVEKNDKSRSGELQGSSQSLSFSLLTMKSTHPNWLRKTLIILLILLAEYTLIGFVILPMLVRHFGEKSLQEHVSAGAVIEKVKINPFTLRFEVIGLELPNKDGAPWIASDAVVLDLSLATAVRWYPVVDELSLQRPFVKVVRESTEGVETPEAKAEDGGGWREAMTVLGAQEIPKFELHQLSVAGGHIEYVDPTQSEAFELLVDPLDFTVLNFSSVDAEEDQFSFAATTPSGTSLRVEGSIQVEERVVLLEVAVKDVQLNELSPYYTDLTNFAVNRAVFGTELEVRVDFLDLDNFLSISELKAELSEVLLERLDDDNRIISLESLVVEGLNARFPEPEVLIERVSFKTGATRVARDSQGKLNLVSLFRMQPSDEPALEIEPEAADGDESVGVLWSIGVIEIEDYTVQWEDRFGGIESDTELFVESFTVEGANQDLSTHLPLHAVYRVGEQGLFDTQGVVTFDGSWLDLEVLIESLPLELAGPYVRDALGAGLTAGTYDMKGQFAGGPEEGYRFDGLLGIHGCVVEQPAAGVALLELGSLELEGLWQVSLPSEIDFDGDLRLREVAVALDAGGSPADLELASFDWGLQLAYGREPALQISGDGSLEDFRSKIGDSAMFELKELSFAGLDFEEAPRRLEMGSVSLNGLDGTFVRLPAENSEAEVEAPEVSANEESNSEGEAFAWKLGAFTISDGKFRFEDRTLEPSPVVELTDLGMELANLSSAPGAVASLDLETKVNKSPFTIKGTLAPSDLKQDTSLEIALGGLALPAFSSYSGAAVGRTIENGTFNLNGDWTIEGSKLKAKNQISLDGFELGEKVPDPAVSLPLDLALTLLRRPDGSISLSLPLSGDLSDPKASVAGIIISAFTNIIMKATTAPFGLIASMMGSEQDISKVEFEPNQANLSPDSISALNLLAEALVDRPSLQLNLVGEYTQNDVDSLKAVVLREELTGGKEVDIDDYNKQLRKAYLRRLKDQGRSDDALPVETDSDLAAVEDVMVESAELAEDAVAQLSASREDAVFDFLTEVKGIAPERIRLSEEAADAAGELSGVRFEVK